MNFQSRIVFIENIQNGIYVCKNWVKIILKLIYFKINYQHICNKIKKKRKFIYQIWF